MNEIRLLFTGIGRRVELIQAFRDAALVLNVRLKIFGADMSDTAPALAFCDETRKVCRMKDPGYITELIRICRLENIDLLIPTIDTDLLVLSSHASEFAPTKVLISSPEMISVCRDKRRTAEFFRQCGCYTPDTVDDWKKYTSGYPCFIKPKDGSSSINAYKVNSEEDLRAYAQHMDDYIIQPFIEGEEYTVDMFCDFEGNPVYVTPRIRLFVRAGEVLKTQIVMDQHIIDECKRIASRFKPIGPLTIQLIRQKQTGLDYFIEINPRFGGGAPLSMRAGARSTEVILKLLAGESCSSEKIISDGAIFSRFDQSVSISSKAYHLPVRGVIFDLDDTLYDEVQYIKSGFRQIASYLGNEDAEAKLWSFYEKGVPAIDAYLTEIERTNERDTCLRIYREQRPEITLNEGVSEFLALLRKQNVMIGIITDGRPYGQRQKINALALNELVDDVIITDELGGEQFRKPCDIAFRIMQRRWRIPFEYLVYIGDNLSKDPQAPKQLGMQFIYLNNQNGIYVRNIPKTARNENLSLLSVSDATVSSFDELRKLGWFSFEEKK